MFISRTISQRSKPEILDTRVYTHFVSHFKWLLYSFGLNEIGKKLNRDNIGFIVENKERHISVNITNNAKLPGVTNKDNEEVRVLM